MLQSFEPPYVQRALLEIVLLAVVAGALGTWVVLRGLSFFSHAVGTAAFPGLVLADGIGFAPLLGALGTAGLLAAVVALLAQRQPQAYDSLTALALVAALATGIILASDVFATAGSVDQLLFGSLFAIDGTDQLLAAMVALLAVAASALIGRRWLATGFDPDGARALGARSPLHDGLLLALVAAAAIAALDAIGALLAAAMLILPAATARLLSDRVGRWQVLTFGTALLQGVLGLWLSLEFNAPPGATIAVVGGVLFALAALARSLPRAGVVAAAAAALFVAGCGGEDETGPAGGGASGSVSVLVTTTQLADVTRAVGGDAVEVTQLLQPNSDPHDYEPRPADIEAAADADLVVTNGDGLDSWIDEVLENAGSDAPVLVAGDGRPVVREGGHHEHEEGEEEPGHAEEEHHEDEHAEDEEVDPHWWHDPRNVRYAAGRIRDALVDAEPTRADAIRAAAGSYLDDLETLDAGIAACIDEIPADHRKLVTDHDAFGYFTDRYGLEVVGAVIPALTTQAQPSAGDLADLAEVIRHEDVAAVFPESSVNSKLAEAIADETGASADYTLYGDSLGPADSPAGTYIGMERANADAIVRGLTGGSQGCSISGL